MEQNWTKNLLPALAVGIGIIILGALLKSAIVHFKDSERVVSVKGMSEREVEADKVIWPLVYKEVGNDLLSLYNTLETTNAKIIEFLKSNGIQESEITVSPAEVIDLTAERYASQDIKYRYNLTEVITVATDKVELVRKLMTRQSDLLKQGIAISTSSDYRYTTQFIYTKFNDVKPQMIEEATKNARASAQKFAVDSQSELGKIQSANQGQFTITDRDANTPYIKTIRVVTTIVYYLKD